MAAELTERQWSKINESRQAMRAVLQNAYPGDFARLWAAAVTSDFVGVCSASLHQGELVGVVNTALREVGLELKPVRRN